MKRRSTKEQIYFIRASQSSGESIEAFCRRHTISVSSFMRWKRTVRAETDTPKRFLPVTIIDQRNGQAVGQCCRIRVGEYITIDYESE